MASLGIVCLDEGDRRALALIAGEAGHFAHTALRLEEAVEILRERRPKLMLVTDGPGQDAAKFVREILRVSPLIPIIVAQKVRDAARAVDLLRTGASEVVAPPWTKESLQACLAKTLRFQGTDIALVHQASRPRRHAPAYLFMVLVFFAVCLAHISVERQARQREAAASAREWWSLPYNHPTAAAFDGKDLYVLDWFSQSLYLHGPAEAAHENDSVRRVIHFPAEAPVSIAFAAESAWSVLADGTIVRHMKDSALTPVQKFPRAAPDTLGIAFDGLYLWTCDKRLKRLHKHLLDDRLTELASYPYPGKLPSALAFDGQTLWSLDSEGRELLRHNLERPDEVIRRSALLEYRDGGYKPVGLAFDGERLWTVGEKTPSGSGPARLFAHKGSAR